MHPERQQRLDDIAALAEDGDWDTIYQRHVFYEFPNELHTGFQLAFLRAFATPDMAAILQTSGSLTTDPMLRAYRTRTFMQEIIYGCITDDRAAVFVRRMNRIHGAFPITQEQLTYILCAFIVVPTRHLDHTGWRAVTAHEREAATRFYGRLGRHMDIDVIPDSYEAAERSLDRYEEAYLAPSPAGAALTQALVDAIGTRLPKPLRPLAPALFAEDLRSPHVVHALGLSDAPHTRIARALTRTRVVSHQLRARRIPPPQLSDFTPGQPVGTYFPNGYTVKDLT